MKLLIDSDPGQDDAVAILLAAKSGACEIKAITTVAGNSTIENVTRNARAILKLGKVDVPVFSGADRPLVKKLITAKVHGPTGFEGFDVSRTPTALTGDAAARIVDLTLANPGQLTILAIGPLTNIATALKMEPRLPQLVKRLVIMGGAINVPGNMDLAAEFNFFVDPDAAKIVFEAPVERVLIPLDLCNQVVLTETDFQAISKPVIRQALLPMMRAYGRRLRQSKEAPGIIAYDALAAYYLLAPEAFETERLDVTILQSGQSVGEPAENGNTLVAFGLDRARFRKDLSKILSG